MTPNDNVSQIIDQAQSGRASEADVHNAYDQVTSTAPPAALAAGLAHAFQSDQTPPFPSMTAKLFEQSNPDQKAGLLSTLLGKVNPAQRSQVLGGTPLATSPANVPPTVAQQVSPQQVEQLAQHAQQQDPSIVDQVSRFYAQHPVLVKTLGAAALGLLLARMTGRR